MSGTTFGFLFGALIVTLGDCGGTSPSTPAPVVPALEICDGGEVDAVDVSDVAIDGDELTLTATYSGGCADHDFQLCWSGAWIKTSPMKAPLALVHDGNGDACRVLISEPLTFDLSPLADQTIAAYPQEGGLWVLLGSASEWYGF